MRASSGSSRKVSPSISCPWQPPEQPRSPRPYVVMETEEGKVALGVDGLVGQEEAVLKALTRPLDRVAGLSGVTILGNGRPVFIVDVPRLLA